MRNNPVFARHGQTGMTLHQYYVGQAISGICGRSFDVEKISGQDLRVPFVEWASDIAIEIADEIIKKLEIQIREIKNENL